MRLKNFFFICAVLIAMSVEAKKWDVEFWQYAYWTQAEWGPYKFYGVGEVRLRKDLTKFYYYRLSECFAYRALPCLDLEAHFSSIYNKSHGATHFTNTQRLEFEINPFQKYEYGVEFQLRNRIELLKRQHVKHIQFVFRQRVRISIPITCCGHLTAYRISNEFFYDFDHHKYSQNRFIPLQLAFDISQKLQMELFFMLRDHFSFSTSKWYRSLVFGSELRF